MSRPSAPSTADVALKACFADPLLDVMNFLNEIVGDFPDAISFAPGRPHDAMLGGGIEGDAIGAFVAHLVRESGRDERVVRRSLDQYSSTNGIITELIAAHLALDENVHVPADSIMVTVGAQEALAVILVGLFDPATDVLLVSDPSYVGITGLARVLGIRTVPVPSGDDGLAPDAVEEAIRRAAAYGRPRALYDIPDFNNPLGTSMPTRAREELLRVCERHNVLIVEDNPYRMFGYDAPAAPTLKSLDTTGRVLYVGSFSKTLWPGIRLGYLVANQRVTADDGTLARALSRVKSFLTVNTPPFAQAIVGGVLSTTGGSLEAIVAPKRARYRAQRDALVAALGGAFEGVDNVRWHRPGGGFFLPMTLPFEFGPDELRRCAAAHGVIVSPMRFFSLASARRNEVRLSFSYNEPDVIRTGVDRFADFVRTQVCA